MGGDLSASDSESISVSAATSIGPLSWGLARRPPVLAASVVVVVVVLSCPVLYINKMYMNLHDGHPMFRPDVGVPVHELCRLKCNELICQRNSQLYILSIFLFVSNTVVSSIRLIVQHGYTYINTFRRCI